MARKDLGSAMRAFRPSISAARSASRARPMEAASRSYLSPTWPALKRNTGGSRTALSPVMQSRFFQGAERVREAMHGAKPLLERQAAFESAHHQLQRASRSAPSATAR